MLSADDKIAIQELIVREYQAIDRHDPVARGAFFVDDGVLTLFGDTRRGRKNIVDFTAGNIAAGAEDGARHVVTNSIVDETPGGAEIRGMVVKLRIDRKPPAVVGYADFRADVVRAHDKWLIKQLDLNHAIGAPAAAR